MPMYQFLKHKICYIFVIFLLNSFCPCTIPLCPVHGANSIIITKYTSKFTHINIYLNVKCILTFLVVLTPKLSLIHENNHICNIHTMGDA